MTKILFVGDLNEYGRGYQRYRTFKEMGCEVTAISHTPVSLPNRIEPPTFLYRVFWKLRIPQDNMKVNKKIKASIKDSSFDVIWIEKGNMIWPWTLRYIKKKTAQTKLVSCSEDDMYAPHGHSFWYRWGLRHYDMVFTTKRYNLDELRQFGARRVELFLDSFDEKTHRPIQLTESEEKQFSCDVSAIGAFEQERAESLLYLAQHGVQVVVWGNGWKPWVHKHPNLVVKNEFLFGLEYSKAICATKINLNFLRKANRDEVTSRSVEIPACGGFMLGERTKRHLEFFEEGKEAEYFGPNEEMLRKIRYYLAHEDERKNISKAGLDRCLKNGYSMRAQLSTMLEITIPKGE